MAASRSEHEKQFSPDALRDSLEEFEDHTCTVHGGFKASRARLGSGWLPFTTCPKCSAARDEDEKRERREKHRADRLASAAISRRHSGATLGNFKTQTQPQTRALAIATEYAERFEQHLADGRCLLFFGDHGTGKTHLAVGIMRAVIDSGRTAFYATLAELLQMLRETWRRDSARSETEVMNFLRGVDLLVIDEIGVQYGSEAERVQVTNVIDARYRDMKPTLVITNCDKEQLREYLTERVLSRLRENGGKGVIFDWGDYRGMKQ